LKLHHHYNYKLMLRGTNITLTPLPPLPSRERGS
jgi:hypothetical protein